MNYPAGKYVNGAISPFTAGELSLAAFENGYEAYGYDILKRFEALWKRDKSVYFLYSRDGGPVSQNMQPSGWGAAALLKAVEQGLSGIRDEGSRFDRMRFAPRWTVTEYTSLRYITGYEKSRVHVDVRYEQIGEVMHYRISSPSVEIDAHILLPIGSRCLKATVNGVGIPFENVFVWDSPYVDFTVFKKPNEKAEIILTLDTQNLS